MKTYSGIIFLTIFTLQLSAVETIYDDTIRYNNKIRKEVGYTEGELVKTTRKLYDRRGRLIEQHFFNGSNKGQIKSYYSDTIVASVISEVYQSIRGEKYTLTVPIGTEIYGFYKGTNIKKYSIIVDSTFNIDYSTSYPRYNVIFNDFVLLHQRRMLKGVEGSKLTYYSRDGSIRAEETIGDLEKGNLYRSFYDNKQVKAEGYIRKVRSSDYYVGKWTFYYKSGIIEKEVKFYNGEMSMRNIKWGTRIDTAIYRYKNAKTQAIVLFPAPEDFNHRTDTIATYYETGQIRSRYDESIKALIRKTGIRRDDVFEFSGLYEEFYEDGELKMRGFLCKPPKRQVSFQERNENPISYKCISVPTSSPVYFKGDKMTKQIGMWYYFDEKGNITDIKEYRLCGDLSKEQLSKRKIEKISKKYRLNKKGFDFDNVIYDNE